MMKFLAKVLILSFFLTIALPLAAAPGLLLINSQLGEPYESALAAMLARLAEHGYSQEAGSLVVRSYSMGNNPSFMLRIESLERENLDNYDLIVVNGTIAAAAAKERWLGRMDRPVLFINVTDPIGMGLIAGFNQAPNSNFSGVSYPVPVVERLRLIRSLLPEARRIGYVYADMPQSMAYTEWLRAAMALPEFASLELVERQVDFVPGENGAVRMVMLAVDVARSMEGEVDVFLAPNDQMGINPEFARRLSQAVAKPLVGLSDEDVLERRGALFSVYPVTERIGTLAADMLLRLLSGASITAVQAQQAPYACLVDAQKAAIFGIQPPADSGCEWF